MKKLFAWGLVLVILMSFSSCKRKTLDEAMDFDETQECQHNWIEATCIAPKTCSLCGKTEGTVSPTSHDYLGDKCKSCGLVQLTLYNYEDYITCNATVRAGNSQYNSSYGYLYTSVKCNFEATGNVHYKYNDVYIKIKFCHYDYDGYKQYLENSLAALTGGKIEAEAVPYNDATYTIKLNLAGNGEKSGELLTPWYSEKSTYSDIDAVFTRTTYEVIEVRGTVQEY